MIFQEDLLHFVWKHRLYDRAELKTHTGLALTIISPGRYNHDSGPDFSDARLQIGETAWAGNVEIHMRSSDWRRHQHQLDQAYDNVILHVVFEHDTEIMRNNGTTIEVLELKNRLDDGLLMRHHNLVHAHQQFIPCEKLIRHVESIHIESWITRLAVERLHQRAARVMELVAENNGDWEETLYRMLARNFGFHVNAEPFAVLAASLPQKVYARHTAFQIEALLFGQAGFLEAVFTDEYPRRLRAEFLHLRRKYQLEPLPHHLWKFFRLRPLNFPTIRVAQFARVMSRFPALFAQVIGCKDAEALAALFHGIEAGEYWETHFRFDRPSAFSVKSFGAAAANHVLINTFSPVLFAYGTYIQHEEHVRRSIRLLEILPPEDNKIVSGFVALQVKPVSAQDSQALLHLKAQYCDVKKCLNCGIGNRLLKSNQI